MKFEPGDLIRLDLTNILHEANYVFMFINYTVAKNSSIKTRQEASNLLNLTTMTYHSYLNYFLRKIN